jgi:pSer/pThr/pTyr-binding forkhead associated (FHA) protein
MAGTYMGQVFPIMGSAVIGREATNGVPLDRDTTASRRHAQITDQGGGYVIQDLGSANGTFVNGSRVTEGPLQPGDEVSIGGTRFRFEV